jgi:hypothetical protein
MVDDCTRAWECWSGQQGSLDSEPCCPDQHSHAGSQFIPGGAQHSWAGMHASYGGRLHSSMGVLGWQWQPKQLRLLLLPQHFHAGSQFIPGEVQYSSAGVYLSNGGRPHSSLGVLVLLLRRSATSPSQQEDKHSQVGWQFVPDGVAYSLAGVSSSNGGRSHSSMRVLTRMGALRTLTSRTSMLNLWWTTALEHGSAGMAIATGAASVAAAAPALPCWIAVHTGRSSVFVGRSLLVQWWTTALEHGSAETTTPEAATSLVLLLQHFHAGSQFIPGEVQHSSAGVYLSNGGRPHSSLGVLVHEQQRVTSVAAGGPALPCWMAVCTGWSSVFVGRRFRVQWWTTALENGSADITASRHFWTAGGHVSHSQAGRVDCPPRPSDLCTWREGK